MRMRQVVLGLACGLAAAASVRADCHDPGKYGPDKLCRKPFVAYNAIWPKTRLAPESEPPLPLESVLMDDVLLTGPGREDEDELLASGKQEVLAKLKEMVVKDSTYEPGKLGGDHLTVHHGFLGLSKTTVYRTAALRWEARILTGPQGETVYGEEEVIALMANVADNSDPKASKGPDWRISLLRINRHAP